MTFAFSSVCRRRQKSLRFVFNSIVRPFLFAARVLDPCAEKVRSAPPPPPPSAWPCFNRMPYQEKVFFFFFILHGAHHASDKYAANVVGGGVFAIEFSPFFPLFFSPTTNITRMTKCRFERAANAVRNTFQMPRHG